MTQKTNLKILLNWEKQSIRKSALIGLPPRYHSNTTPIPHRYHTDEPRNDMNVLAICRILNIMLLVVAILVCMRRLFFEVPMHIIFNTTSNSLKGTKSWFSIQTFWKQIPQNSLFRLKVSTSARFFENHMILIRIMKIFRIYGSPYCCWWKELY